MLLNEANHHRAAVIQIVFEAPWNRGEVAMAHSVLMRVAMYRRQKEISGIEAVAYGKQYIGEEFNAHQPAKRYGRRARPYRWKEEEGNQLMRRRMEAEALRGDHF